MARLHLRKPDGKELRLKKSGPTPPPPPPPTGEARLGVNLAGYYDYGTELPFVDVFRGNRGWSSQRNDPSDPPAPELVLDAQGYPTLLEPNYYASAAVLWDISPHFPGGLYTLLFDGTGTVGSVTAPWASTV